MPLLQLDKATIRFGGLTAVNAVDLTVAPGELRGLIGPNGSGKTTTIAKLSSRFHRQGKKILLGAADTFRAAAMDQRVSPGLTTTTCSGRVGPAGGAVLGSGQSTAAAGGGSGRGQSTSSEVGCAAAPGTGTAAAPALGAAARAVPD